MLCRPRTAVWMALCTWQFLTTLCYGTVVLLIYLYESYLDSLVGEGVKKIMQTTMVILGGWTLVTFGVCVRTARGCKRSMALIFLLFAVLSFAAEFLILIVLARKREEIVSPVFVQSALLRLVSYYSKVKIARRILNSIHTHFDCCGVDEWHREWKTVEPYPPGAVATEVLWVPPSCCLRRYQSDPLCGFARNREPITTEQVVRLIEYDLETVIPEPWLAKIKNEPCTDMITDWVQEIPVYFLMVGLAITISRLIFTLYAVFCFTKSRRKKK
ncbi:unnamed protein product [Calicophoron daubneyi]|uniref:Tetraspanin n=1 Tax=Calicophoron daubneyi TaxID=300641 RepID=A0AAV2T5P7_CALDB